MNKSTLTMILGATTVLVPFIPKPYDIIAGIIIGISVPIIQHLQNKDDEIADKERSELLNELNKNITGGENRPIIKFQISPLMHAPNQEGVPFDRLIKYKSISIVVSNQGETPIRHLSITTSGFLGLDINVPSQLGTYFAPKGNVHEILERTIAPGQSLVLFKADYNTWASRIEFVFNVTWEFGFYNLRTLHDYPVPHGELYLMEKKLLIGSKEVDYNEYFSNKKV